MTKHAAPESASRGNSAVRAASGVPGKSSRRGVKLTPVIRDAIIQAAVEAGEGDMVAYLKKQAETHPSAFMTLLGKVLPLQLTGGKGQPVNLELSVRFVARDVTEKPTGDGR